MSELFPIDRIHAPDDLDTYQHIDPKKGRRSVKGTYRTNWPPPPQRGKES